MRWLDDVSMGLRKMSTNEWRDRARNRETWRHIVADAKTHPGLYSHLEEEEEDLLRTAEVNLSVVVTLHAITTVQ